MILADAASQATDPTTLIILVGGGAIVMYMMTRLSRARKKGDPLAQPFQARSLSQQRSVERDFEGLLVQLSEMSRQMTAQLDTRAAKLEALIADADERAARLKAVLERTPARPVFREIGDGPAAEPHGSASSSSSLSPLSSSRDVSAVRDTAVDTRADALAAASAAAFENLAPAPRVDPQHAEIYRLADEGRVAREIASELNRPSGEVELILALRGREK